MLTIFSHFLIFFFIIFGYGVFFFKIFKVNRLIYNFNFFEIPIFGLIFFGLVSQIYNFFYPLNDNFLFINILLSLVFIIKFFKNYKVFFHLNNKFFYCFLLLLTLTKIYGSDFADDIDHYHYSYISNTDTTNYIFGLNFLNNHYGYSPIWLIVNSALNFDLYRLQDIHITNSIPFFLVSCALSYKIFFQIKKKNINLNFFIKIFVIFFIFLKYSRLEEYGIDRSINLLFFYYLIFYLENIFILKDKKNFENLNTLIHVLFIFSLFIFFNRIFFIFIFLFPLSLLVFIKFKKLFFNYKIIFSIIFGLSYFLKNIIISGCLIYPLSFTCFDFLSWSSKSITLDLIRVSQIWNKSFHAYDGPLSSASYISGLNWVGTWFSRNSIEIREFLLLLIVCIFLSFLICKHSKNLRKKINIKFELISIFPPLLFFFILWFFNTPVVRMSHHIFILFFIFIYFLVLYFYDLKVVKVYKKTFYSILFCTLIFNFSKNLNRISENDFLNDPLSTIISKGKYYPSIKNKLDSFVYYIGWIEGNPIGNEDLSSFNYKEIENFKIIYKNKF